MSTQTTGADVQQQPWTYEERLAVRQWRVVAHGSGGRRTEVCVVDSESLAQHIVKTHNDDRLSAERQARG